jgi:hypothetical protein
MFLSGKVDRHKSLLSTILLTIAKGDKISHLYEIDMTEPISTAGKVKQATHF